MKINKISSKNFGGIYFENKDLEMKIRLQIEDLPRNEQNKLNKLIYHNLTSDKYDIHVKKDGIVYIQDAKTKNTTEIFGNVSILNKFQAALGYARIKEIKDAIE